MADHAQLIRIAKYRPDPGVRDELLARMEELATAMRDLPGVFGAQVCRVAEASEWLAIVSRWQDEESAALCRSRRLDQHTLTANNPLKAKKQTCVYERKREQPVRRLAHELIDSNCVHCKQRSGKLPNDRVVALQLDRQLARTT